MTKLLGNGEGNVHELPHPRARASPTAERIQLKDPTLSTTSPGGIQLLDQQPSDSFVGVNRRPHVALLIHKSIAPRDEQYCDGCSYLEQGNSRCELFDMHLGNDEEMPCGEGWFRTTQCLEAAGEAKLYQVKTNGIERSAARSVVRTHCSRHDKGNTTHRCSLSDGHDGPCNLVRVRHG